MTDNEIIKTLEKHKHVKIILPKRGELYINEILDLINRKKAAIERLQNDLYKQYEELQQAKAAIERLQNDLYKQYEELQQAKAEIERLKYQVNRLKEYDEKRDIALHSRLIATTRAETVKEVVERLKDLKHECGCNYRKKPVFAVTEDKIDNLVKEMEVKQ